MNICCSEYLVVFVLVIQTIITKEYTITNQSVKPPSFLQTLKIPSNYTKGMLAGEQQLVPPETEVTREVQEVATKSDKMGVGVVDAEAEAVVVEVLDIVVAVEWVNEKLLYGSLPAERLA